MTCEDRVYAGASLAFDVSVEEMWCAFFAGAAEEALAAGTGSSSSDDDDE